MPSAGKIKGRLLNIYIGSDIIGCATESSLSISRDEIDATCKDSNDYGESLGGQISWSLSSSSLYAIDESNESFEDFFDALIADTLLTAKISTGVTGDTYYTGSVRVTSLELSATDGDVSSYSVTLNGSGAISKATEA